MYQQDTQAAGVGSRSLGARKVNGSKLCESPSDEALRPVHDVSVRPLRTFYAVLLLAWANARAKGNSDVAVIVNKDTLFARTACYVASGGVEARGGWHCIFSDMPHLCAFDTKQVRSLFSRFRAFQTTSPRAVNRNCVDILVDWHMLCVCAAACAA